MRLIFVLGLLLIQDPAVDALLKQLADESIEVREKAAASLVAMGDKAEERIQKEAATATGDRKARLDSILTLIRRVRNRRLALPADKVVTIAAKGVPLNDVLDQFRKQTGMPVEIEGDGSVPVTADLKEATPLEALGVLCRAAKLGFDSFKVTSDDGRDGEKIVLSARGWRDTPRQAGRHYQVEAVGVSITRTWQAGNVATRGTLALTARWLPGTEPDNVEILVSTIVDDRGATLFERHPLSPRIRQFNYFPGGKRPLAEMQQVPVREPSKEATSVAVKGAVVARYAIDETKAAFDAPEKNVGAKLAVDGITFLLKTLASDEKGCRVVLVLEGEGITYELRPKLRARLEDGTKVDLPCGRTTDPTPTFTGTCGALKSPIASLEVSAGDFYHEERFEFELKDIPLPK